MKRFLLMMALVILATSAVGAQNEPHLKFMGIEIDGKLSVFGQKLEKKGFTEITRVSDRVLYEGKFAGRYCNVVVSATSNNTEVFQVIVILEDDNWSDIKSCYFDFKKSLSEKYTRGLNVEYFQDPYYEGDGYELSAIIRDKCNYVSFFDAEGGKIMLKIGGGDEPQVRIVYEDKQNVNIFENNSNNQMMNDI